MRVDKLLSSGLLVISFLIVFPSFTIADPLDNWHLRYEYDLFTGRRLNAVTYANGIFVAVGVQGTILSSADGITWAPRTSGTSMELNRVTYGNGLFVAVGNHGTILISPDGGTWTPRTAYSGTTEDINAIAYGNGIFVALGDSTVLTSPDGYTWIARTLADGTYSNAVWFCGTTFVSLGTFDIFTSPDGVTWTKREYLYSDKFLHSTGIAFGNGTIVGVGWYGKVLTSPDGIIWTERNSGTSDDFYDVAYGQNTFVAVGGIFHDAIFTSPDGIAWTQRNPETSAFPNGVTYGNGTFVAVGFDIIQSDPLPMPYSDTVQKIFIGYYQRPADPGGLIYWAERLDATGGNLTEIIEAFANSAESQALYGTINSSNISTVVNGIYNALFGRNAEAEGLNYYVNGFNSGHFTAATIMLNVLYGAQNEDLQSVNNKLAAANLFTRTIDPELDGANFLATYSGNADAQKARDFLPTVGWDSATIPTQAETTLFIKNNIADPGDPILNP
jgi:hypothetical protein